jgi:FkbM family methyltransferase
MLGDERLYNVLAKFFEETGSSDFSLVQIGAADGRDHVNELILKYGKANSWNCLFVEPGLLYFNSLKETYKDTGYLFENSAISNKTEEAIFYRVFPSKMLEQIKATAANPASIDINDTKGKKAFAKALKRSSLVASNYLLRVSHEETGEEPAFYKTVVPCLSLKDLLLKHNLEKVDFLHVDAEGYDFEIIKQINFSSRFRPLLICYEEWGGSKLKEEDDMSGKISLGPSTSSKCRTLLQKNKYFTHVVESGDTTKNIIAIDSTRLDFKF